VAKRLTQRAGAILLAFDGLDNEAIGARVGLERHQVGIWRRRWQRAFGKLIKVECLEAPAVLRKAIEAVLADEQRPGCPGKFTPEQLALILAVACEPPEKSGRPITHWTGQELADEVVQRGIVEAISASQVNRYLRQAALQPHKSRYWLNTSEKDPELFQAQVEMVCACYHDAPQLYYHHDTHTFCVDEMTGIQALGRVAATLPMRPGQEERREFEYKRHGTLTLIGNFHTVTGELVAPTLGPTRTEEDFVAHIEQTVKLDPTAGHVFVADNLNVHQSAGLVGLVARLCGVEGGLGKKGVRGVLKSMKSRQQFLSDLGHRIRFVYLPKHSSWLNQIEIVFGVVMRKVIRRGDFKSVEDLRGKLLAFIQYFNDVFARPFNWTYTGRPLRT
jgi:transposase